MANSLLTGTSVPRRFGRAFQVFSLVLALLLGPVLLVFGNCAMATTYTCTGGQNLRWPLPSTWTPTGYPEEGDTAVIRSSSVELFGARTIKSIDLTLGTLNSDYDGGALTLDSGNSAMTDSTVNVPIVVNPGATLSIYNVTFTKKIENYGTIMINNGVNTSVPGMILGNGVVLNNHPGATMGLAGGTLLTAAASGQAIINNDGAITSSLSYELSPTFAESLILNNSGTISVKSGDLKISGGSSNGTFDMAPGSTLSFAAGEHSLLAGVKFTGSGNALIATDGTAKLVGTIPAGTSSAGLILSGGTLVGTTTGKVNGVLKLSGGYIRGPVTLLSGATANWTSGNLQSLDGAVVNIVKGATLQVSADGTWGAGGTGTSVLKMTGTLLKTGTTTSNFAAGLNLQNTGLVQCSGGVLGLSDGTSSGVFQTDAAGSIRFFAGTHVLTSDSVNRSGPKFTGAGIADITAGTVTIKGTVPGSYSGGKLRLNGGVLSSDAAGGSISGGIDLDNGTLAGNLTIVAGVTANWAPASRGATLLMQGDATFTVNQSATLAASNGGVWGSAGAGTQKVNLRGLFSLSSDELATFMSGVGFNNAGTVKVTNGELVLADGSSSGTFNVQTPGSIVFKDGMHTFSATAKCTGNGVVGIRGGTVAINGTAIGGANGGTLALQEGRLTGGKITGTVSLQGGTIGGTFGIARGGVATLEAQGQTLRVEDGATFTTDSGGVLKAVDNTEVRGVTGALVLAGILEIDPAASPRLNLPFSCKSTGIVSMTVSRAALAPVIGQLRLSSPTNNLDGKLNLLLAPGYLPAPGSTYNLINGQGVSGRFRAVSSPFVATYDPNGGVSVNVPSGDSLFLSVNPDVFSESSASGSVMGTVSRNGATTTSRLVTLTNSNTTRLTLPNSVALGAGASSANFVVKTVNNSWVDGDATATITATAPALNSASTQVSVIEDDVPKFSISFSQTTFPENTPDGTLTGVVTRNTSLTTALSLTLTSTNAKKVLLSTSTDTVPGANITLVIPAGSASAAFNLYAINNNARDGDYTVRVTAARSGYVSAQRDLTVQDEDVDALSLSINTPTTFAENASVNGTPATTGVVSLGVSIGTAVTVTVRSLNATKVTFPGATVDNSSTPPRASIKVVIPAGTISVPFNILAVNNNVADGDTTVPVTAEAFKYVTQSQDVVVTDNDASALRLTVSPGVIQETSGTSAATATITRNTSDLSVPLTVTLTSRDANRLTFAGANFDANVSPPLASVTVTIPANAVSVSVPVQAIDNSVLEGNVGVFLTASATGFVSSTFGVTVDDDEVSASINVPGRPGSARSF